MALLLPCGSGAGGEHAASAVAAVGAPAGGDVEPLDPHRRRGVRVRRGKTVAAAIAIAICGWDAVVAVVGAAVVFKNRREVEVRRGGGGVVALVEQEVGVVDERVVSARRRRPTEQRPASLLLLGLFPFLVLLPRFAPPFSLLSAAGGGGVEQEGRGAEDEVGGAWLGVDPAWPRRAQHRRRLRLPAAPGRRRRRRRGLDEHPPHGSRRHAVLSKICSGLPNQALHSGAS